MTTEEQILEQLQILNQQIEAIWIGLDMGLLLIAIGLGIAFFRIMILGKNQAHFW